MLQIYAKALFLRRSSEQDISHGCEELPPQAMDEIQFEELRSNMKDFLLVDIRRPDELRNSGKLPGAYNLPLEELEEALNLSPEDFKAQYGFSPNPDIENKLVIYCQSGRRVGIAQDILCRKGFTKHRLYLGSFRDWASKGGTIEGHEDNGSLQQNSLEIKN